MQIALHNIEDSTRVVSVDGPHVDIVLSDAGCAHVGILVALSDGRSFNFPDPAGRSWPQTMTLPPGDYACTLVVAAIAHGAFGRRYDGGVVIGDKLIATVHGDVADGAECELGSRRFVLRVS